MRSWGFAGRATQSVLSAKERSALLALVVAVSTAGLALTVSFISSSYRMMTFALDLAGRRTCYIHSELSPFASAPASKHHLDLDDLKALKERLGSRASLYPLSGSSKVLTRGARHVTSFVLGKDPSEFQRETLYTPRLAEGRFIQAEDLQDLARVCMLNLPAKKALFGNEQAATKEIRVGELPFQVVGVFDTPDLMGFKGTNCIIWVPLTTCMRRLLNVTALNGLSLDVRPGCDAEAVAKEAADLLRTRHEITPPQKDDFAIETPAQTQQSFEEQLRTVRVVGALIIAVGFLLSVWVLGQVQFLAVNHRTAEIGIRRAIGASRADILKDFLAESLFISACGTAWGLLLTAAIIPIIHRAFYEAPTNYSGGSLFSPYAHLQLDVWVLAACAIAAIAVGLLAGVLPAYRAARLDPVEALR